MKEEDALREFIEKPVDILKLVKNLDFSEENIEHAAAVQPKLYLDSCRYRVQKMKKRLHAEGQLALISAEKGIKLRERKGSDGKKTLTEGAIKERIAASPFFKKVRRRLERSHVEEEFAKGLVDAFRQRKDAIKVIADIRMSEGLSEMRIAREKMTKKQMRRLAEDVQDRYRKNSRGDDDDE